MRKDSHDFWESWQSHCQGLLKKSLKRTGGNIADAEDALSTAMLRALEAFPHQAHQLLNMEAWLTRILHNACVDMHRRRHERAAPPWEEMPGEQEAPPSGLPTPEQHLLQREQLLALRRRLAALPEPLRQPCAMRLEQGMAYEEIASALGLSVVNARRRVFLSRRHLRDTLE